MSIARSKNPLGPYDSCERNPVLKPTAHLGTDVVYTGHGDLFQDSDDRWWLTCLGVRKTEVGDSIMGRETFLTSVDWTDDDHGDPWPVIEQPIAMTVSLPTPSAPPAPLPFDKINLAKQAGVDYVWTRNPDMASYKTSWADESISLRPSSTSLKSDGSEPTTFIGKRQRELVGEARAVLSISSLRGKNTLSGLVYYKDEHRHASISFDSAANTIVFEVFNRAKREPVITRETIYTIKDTDHSSVAGVEFRLAYTERCLEFHYRLQLAGGSVEKGVGSETSGVRCGIVDTVTLTDQDFTGPCIGLFATLATASSTEATPMEALWCDFSGVSLVG